MTSSLVTLQRHISFWTNARNWNPRWFLTKCQIKFFSRCFIHFLNPLKLSKICPTEKLIVKQPCSKIFLSCSKCTTRYELVYNFARTTIWGDWNVRLTIVYTAMLLGAPKNVYKVYNSWIPTWCNDSSGTYQE